MSDRSVKPAAVDRALGPIELMARAELARSERSRAQGVSQVPLELVPPLEVHRPQGLLGAVDASLGPVELPGLVAMKDALRTLATSMSEAADDDPLSRVVIAVLEEEETKINRYLTVRDS